MRHSIFALALAIFASTNLAAETTGIVEFDIPAAHHNQDMQVAVMFPATGGQETLFADNAVFYGTPLLESATPKSGRYPLILLSHGWGGNYARMAWLSAGLASQGAIVVSVNHPNSTTFDIDFNTAFNHWTRAEDLSVVLDHVLQDDRFVPYIDETQVYATGFSYGGWTALSIAGVQGSREGFAQYCTAAGTGSQFCAELAAEGVEIAAIDQTSFEASYKDPRISRVAAIDPGLTWALTEEDVQDLTAPLLLIGLGEGINRLQATDTSEIGSRFEALVPNAAVEIITPAMHFTALGICKPAGKAILIEEKDDPVCTDPIGTERTAVLAEIVELLVNHFGLN